jgi:hypothetical protein
VQGGAQKVHSFLTNLSIASQFITHTQFTPQSCLPMMGAHRIAVFDFDQTLAAAEVSMWIDRASMPRRGFGGEERIAMLDHMLRELRNHDIICTICSVNSRDVIRSALDTVGLLGYFCLGEELKERLAAADPDHLPANYIIRDRADYTRHGSRKSAVIAQTILAPLRLSYDGLLFVDDDTGHIKDVSLRLPGATVMHVPRPSAPRINREPRPEELPQGGMHAAQCEAILAWARGEAPQAVDEPPSPEVVPPPQAVGESGATSGPCAFKPKRQLGPLAAWCANCGGHESAHALVAIHGQ